MSALTQQAGSSRTSQNDLTGYSGKPSATESHPMSMQNASYPYHAHSSTWNPVSRQDSELQSQSSGAAPGGDTTDDNYSVLRPSAYADDSKHRHYQSSSRITSRNDRKKHHQHVSSSREVKNKESAHFIPRPKIPTDSYSLATKNPDKFAAELCDRLNHVLAQKSADSKLKGILDLNKTKSSVYEQDLESDQSILDEHVDRVFNERHNVSSMSQMDNSRISASYHAGYRTLDTSSASARQHHHSAFGKFCRNS